MKLLDSDKRGKMSLRKFFMEKSLGPEETWLNYDLMNRRILPSNLTLQQQIPPKEIVKRRNGLFIVDADGGNVQPVQGRRDRELLARIERQIEADNIVRLNSRYIKFVWSFFGTSHVLLHSERSCLVQVEKTHK